MLGLAQASAFVGCVVWQQKQSDLSQEVWQAQQEGHFRFHGFVRLRFSDAFKRAHHPLFFLGQKSLIF